MDNRCTLIGNGCRQIDTLRPLISLRRELFEQSKRLVPTGATATSLRGLAEHSTNQPETAETSSISLDLLASHPPLFAGLGIA